MKFILGLDPGIASIGWALILEAENDNEKSKIIDSNVVKIDFDNFAYMNAKGKISEGKPIEMYRKGLTVSPNLVRRQKRGAHRNLQRYKQRRADLIVLLRENGFIDDDIVSVESEDGKVQFIGIYDPEELPGNDASNLYLGADNQLYWPSADFTLNAFRAYFHVNLEGSSGAREIRMNLDGGGVTGVQSVSGKRLAVSETGAWFDLFGRKLNGKPTVPGIYMNNGKKIAITK